MGWVWMDYVVVLTCVGEQGRNARIETGASKIPCMHVAVKVPLEESRRGRAQEEIS